MPHILWTTQQLIDKVDKQENEINELKKICHNHALIIYNNTKILNNEIVELKKIISELSQEINTIKSNK
jgi:hypothetical protein